MDFALSELQQSIRDTFRDFAEREVRPRAKDLDKRPRFPRDLFRKAGELVSGAQIAMSS